MKPRKGICFYLTIFSAIIGMLSTLETVLSWLDFMPFYRVERHKLTEITPTMRLFPAQQVKLKAIFQDRIKDNDIESISWKFFKENQSILIEKLEPILTLPENDGSYQLNVVAHIRGESFKRTGKTTIHIVETEPIVVEFDKDKVVKLNKTTTDPSFIEEIKKHGVEFLTVSKKWKKGSVLSQKSTEVKLPKNEKIPLYEGRALMRSTLVVPAYSSTAVSIEPENIVKDETSTNE